MPQERIESAAERQRKNVLLSRTPSWLDRRSCTLTERPDGRNINLYYYCPGCSPDKKLPCHTVYLGKYGAKLSAEQKAIIICEKIQDSHGKHNDSHEAPELATQQRLQNDVKATKRKLTTAQCLLAEAERQVQRSKPAVAAVTEQKRQVSRAESRRVDIDPENKEKVSADDLSTAKLASVTGLIDTVKYWAQGSVAAVLQIVMMLITTFGLESQVAAELSAELDETNQYIVNRAKESFDILKECRTEEQRQHYRVVLTALAPEKVEERHAGMSRRVAAALGVNRNRPPFKDSVAKRAEIDAAAVHMGDPVVAGDTVLV